jgi:hypothetical protein
VLPAPGKKGAMDDMQADKPIGRMEASMAQPYKTRTVQGYRKVPRAFHWSLVNDILVINAQSSVWWLTVLSEVEGCTGCLGKVDLACVCVGPSNSA